MVNLLKSFGKGILYIIGLPFFILILLLYAIFGIFLFFFSIIKAIVLFFTGRSLFEDLPEDKKAKEILHPSTKQPEKVDLEEQNEPMPEPQNQEEIKQEEKVEPQPQYIPPIYPSVFTPEYVPPKEEENNEEIIPEPEEEFDLEEKEDIDQDDEGFFPNFLDKNEEEEEPIPVNKEPETNEEPILEKYTPRTSVFDDFDDEEEESDNGVRVERSDK